MKRMIGQTHLDKYDEQHCLNLTMYVHISCTLIDTPQSFYGRSRKKQATIHNILTICHVSEIVTFVAFRI